MIATNDHFKKMFGKINEDSFSMPKCACVACNSCTCACSCKRSSELETIEWEE